MMALSSGFNYKKNIFKKISVVSSVSCVVSKGSGGGTKIFFLTFHGLHPKWSVSGDFSSPTKAQHNLLFFG